MYDPRSLRVRHHEIDTRYLIKNITQINRDRNEQINYNYPLSSMYLNDPSSWMTSLSP